MVKFFGTPLCPDCRAAKELMAEKGIQCEYIDITASTANLKAFLNLRDNSPVYDSVKAAGGIGIPSFVMDDGTVTLGADWLNGEGSCCKEC